MYFMVQVSNIMDKTEEFKSKSVITAIVRRSEAVFLMIFDLECRADCTIFAKYSIGIKITEIWTEDISPWG